MLDSTAQGRTHRPGPKGDTEDLVQEGTLSDPFFSSGQCDHKASSHVALGRWRTMPVREFGMFLPLPPAAVAPVVVTVLLKQLRGCARQPL